MRKISVVLGTFLITTATFSLPVRAAEEPAATTAPSAGDDAAAADPAVKRAASIVSSLKIDDPAKAARVKDVIAAQFNAIHQWHADNDAKRKASATTEPTGPKADAAKEIQASYQALHDKYITALSADLTPEQIDTVKDKMTGGQMKATLNNYPEIVPNLTDEDMAMIRKTLLDAREDAMDAANRNERIAIFKKYKGRINIYLNAHGHNVSQSYKDFGQAQKAKKAAATEQATEATTKPSAD